MLVSWLILSAVSAITFPWHGGLRFFLDSLIGSQFSIIIIEGLPRKVSDIGQITEATGTSGKTCRCRADAATSIVNYCDIWESNPKIVANEHRSRIDTG